MLKKLRIKFIIINMSIVTIMLGIIFSLLYYSTSRNLERESMQMMGTIAMNPLHLAPPDDKMDDVRLPYFSVIVNRAGEMTGIGGGFFDLSDAELLHLLLQMTYETHTSSGVLEDYNLRFIRTETPMGQCIVFADITSEQSTLKNLVKAFAVIGSAAFLVFLGISILLANWAVKPVEKAWIQQKQFVADASHELKTPLTVIMTDAELLQAPQCSEAEREQLSGSIVTMSGQMRGLAESLLELARIDSGSIRRKQEILSLSENVSTTAMMFEPVFYEKEMPFSYEIEPDIMIKGDDAQIKQLVEILLDNALKYTSPGGKTKLGLRRTKHRHCLLTVSNEGEPISEEDLKNLFKRFYRADKARTMSHSYGLGLSIAQSIVEEHNGRIRAESQGGWNCFYVEFPTR